MPDVERTVRRADVSAAWYPAVVGTAVVAGVFSLIVCALLVLISFRGTISDPLDSDVLRALKADLLKQPQDEATKQRVRDVDLQLRLGYFARQASAARGTWLLLGGLVVLAICLKLAATFRKKLPMPQPKGDEVNGEVARAAVARRSVATVSVLLAACGLALVLLYGSGLTERALEPSEAAPAATYPTAEEIKKNWPCFRGPGGLGISAYTDVPASWNGKTGEGVLWKTAVPLPGVNSPVVWGDRIFLTGATDKERAVYCFDANSGAMLWQKAIERLPGASAEPPTVTEDTGFAAPTAVTDGQRVYAIFANGDLVSFDFAGNRAWARNLGSPDNPYGHASSLAMYRNLLLVLYDQGSVDDVKSKLLAIDAASSRTAWEKPRPVPSSWASPIVIDTGKGEQFITCGDPWVISYDPANGTELWRANCLGGYVAPSPVFGSGLVFAVNTGSKLAAIRPDGQGDVTTTHIAWTAKGSLPDICSPLCDGKRLYLMTSEGGLTCYDVKDGHKLWKQEFDVAFNTSPSLVGDRVYVMGCEGVMFILAAADTYKELGKAELGEEARTCPAFLSGRIYIRGAKNLYCIGKKPN